MNFGFPIWHRATSKNPIARAKASLNGKYRAREGGKETPSLARLGEPRLWLAAITDSAVASTGDRVLCPNLVAGRIENFSAH